MICSCESKLIWTYSDCAENETCVLCTPCFLKTHPQDDPTHPFANHNTSYNQCASGGRCDCGDADAWIRDIGCSDHPLPKVDPADDAFTLAGPVDSNTLAVESLLADVIDYVLSVLSRGSLVTTKEAEIVGQIEACAPGPYVLQLWNDPVSSFDSVAHLLQQKTGCTFRQGGEQAEVVDSVGRASVARSSEKSRVAHAAFAMAGVGLGVSIVTYKQDFEEELLSTLISWIGDLARSYSRPLLQSLAKVILQPSRYFKACSSRLQVFFLLGQILWKRPRDIFKDVCVNLLRLGDEVKFRVGTSIHLLQYRTVLIVIQLRRL